MLDVSSRSAGGWRWGRWGIGGAVAGLFLLTTSALGQTAPTAPAVTTLPAVPLAQPQTMLPSEVLLWTLVAAIVMVMVQLGFAMIGAGLTRAKNAAHSFSLSFLLLPLVSLAFAIYGFGLGSGGQSMETVGTLPADHGWGIVGTHGYFMAGASSGPALGYFCVLLALVLTAAVVPTGALLERWRWNNFCLYGLWVVLPISLFLHWTWGGGWLARVGTSMGLGHGYIDYAGSGVVHLMGGAIGLAGALVLGPRIGKFIRRKATAIPGHNLPMSMTGTLVLALGWCGFNGGFVQAGTDIRIAFIVHAFLAAGAASIAAMLTMIIKFGKPDPSMMCNGMLAGLVAISGAAPLVSPIGAIIIGLLAGVMVVYSVFFWDNMGVDDPVGALSVHGTSGLLGVLAVGLFASGNVTSAWQEAGHGGTPIVGIMPLGGSSPWFSGEAFKQLGAQGLGACVCVIVGMALAYALFRLSNLISPMRASREAEIQGCDLPEMGALAFPEFELKTTQSVSDLGASPIRY